MFWVALGNENGIEGEFGRTSDDFFHLFLYIFVWVFADAFEVFKGFQGFALILVAPLSDGFSFNV